MLELFKATTGKQLIGIIVAFVIIVTAMLIPGSDTLSHQGVLTLGIFAMAACLWICESIPVGVTGLLAIILTVVFGLVDIGSAFSGFAAQTIFYLLAAYALTAIFNKTTYGMRLIAFLLKKTKGDSKMVVLAFMVAAALLSSVMSDTAVVILFIGFAKSVLDALGFKQLETNFGRCLYLGLLYGAIIGGFATLAGGTNNLLVLQISGITISFLDWMKVGVPITVVMVPIAWFFMTIAFKPERIDKEKANDIISKVADFGPTTFYEKKALVYIVALPVLWIAGSWVPVLNVTLVALIGLVFCFLPGVQLFSWSEYQAAVPWSVLLMVGSILSLSGLLVSTGVTEFVTGIFQAIGVFNMPFSVGLFVFLFVAYAIFTLCPVGGAWEALFIPVLMSYCTMCGVSVTVAPLAILFAFGGNFLLPINPLNMYAYDHGYFAFGDMFKAGFVPAMILLILDALWTPFIVGALGF